jgi:hypothetical protein
MILTHKLCAWALLILGAIHVGYTAIAYKTWSLPAAWFLGAGLSFIFLGLLNLATVVSFPVRTVVWSCFIANLLGLAFLAGVVVLLPKPQAFIGVVLMLILLGTTTRLGRKQVKRVA